MKARALLIDMECGPLQETMRSPLVRNIRIFLLKKNMLYNLIACFMYIQIMYIKNANTLISSIIYHGQYQYFISSFLLSCSNACIKSYQGSLFDDTQFVMDVYGSGNNFAHGHFYYGPQYRSNFEEGLRKNAEQCDSLQTFLVTPSLR